MKKIGLAVILICLLAGVSYIKSVRKAAGEDEAFRQGRREAISEAVVDLKLADSLQTELGRQTVAFADSLIERGRQYNRVIDSLSETLVSGADSISNLNRELKASLKKRSDFTQRKSTASKAEIRNKKILADYRKRYESLPADLSKYELKVALNELRGETADKFGISLRQLGDLRKKANLQY